MAGEFTPITRGLIARRAGDRCEICRVAAIEQFHHRRARAMGGSKRPDTGKASNGLGLCGPCHGWVERYRTEALKLGYLVRQNHVPSNVAVCLDGRFLFLTDSGTYQDPPQEAD